MSISSQHLVLQPYRRGTTDENDVNEARPELQALESKLGPDKSYEWDSHERKCTHQDVMRSNIMVIPDDCRVSIVAAKSIIVDVL